MIGMENPSSTGKDSGIYSVEYRIVLDYFTTRPYNLYAGQDKGNNNIISSSFVQHCWRSIPATYMCSNLFLDHNVFLHLKVGVSSTFCNCCYVKEGKLLPVVSAKTGELRIEKSIRNHGPQPDATQTL